MSFDDTEYENGWQSVDVKEEIRGYIKVSTLLGCSLKDICSEILMLLW